MTKPRLTSECRHDRMTPRCPHCHDHMMGAELTFEMLVDAYPLPARIEVGSDGYAHGHQALVLSCTSCGAPSAVAIDALNVKLVAMRTAKDERYLVEHAQGG